MTKELKETSIESISLNKKYDDVKEKMAIINRQITNTLNPVKNIYGINEIIKSSRLVDKIGRNDNGNIFKEYFRDGMLYLKREKILNDIWKNTYYDDNGTAYLQKYVTLLNNKALERTKFIPNNNIVINNFSAKTDSLGRLIENKITNLNVKNVIEQRESLNGIHKNELYRINDHKGHLIADRFYGPNNIVNIVPQLDTVNLGAYKRLENYVASCKTDNNTVDYSIKVNYSGRNYRPTSFEPKVIVDNKKIDLPKEFRKIYNDNLDTLGKRKTDFNELFMKPHLDGVEAMKFSAFYTGCISAVDNIVDVYKGNISWQEAIKNIPQDIITSGIISYGSVFISEIVAKKFNLAALDLFNELGNVFGNSIVPILVMSLDSIVGFVQGDIDIKELFLNTSNVLASYSGTKIGAMLGGSFGPMGAFVGSIIGTIVMSMAYQTAVELGIEGQENILKKVKEHANTAIEYVNESTPQFLFAIQEAINKFNKLTNLNYVV